MKVLVKVIIDIEPSALDKEDAYSKNDELKEAVHRFFTCAVDQCDEQEPKCDTCGCPGCTEYILISVEEV